MQEIFGNIWKLKSNRNKCCIEIRIEGISASGLKQSNRNKCCIEILQKILIYHLRLRRTETSVVLKSVPFLPISADTWSNRNKCCIEIGVLFKNAASGLLSNRNKCCIEILLSSKDMCISFSSNRNKCCIEINDTVDETRKMKGRTETSVVLKSVFHSVYIYTCFCRTETSVVLKLPIFNPTLAQHKMSNRNKCCIEIL